MELGIEIIDLRTKQQLLDYMENYEVEVPIIEKEDDYEEDYEENFRDMIEMRFQVKKNMRFYMKG